MPLDAYLIFDGDCRDAMKFYAAAFNAGMPKFMTYGEAPGGAPAEDKDRVLYGSMPIFGQTLMFCDGPGGQPHIKGNNVALTLGLSGEAELRRIFGALSEGGEVYMPLEKTFFSELFGMVRDKFGIIWQLSKAL